MADGYWVATLKKRHVVVKWNKKITIEHAEERIKAGKDVYTTKAKAKNLAKRLGGGKSRKGKFVMSHDKRDVEVGQTGHFHDKDHKYDGHIFYGDVRA